MKRYGPFSINAKAGAPAELLIYGPIGDSWDDNSVTAAQFVRDLQNIDAGEINLRINSVGGSVFDALAIHNALERHPATVNVHVDGIALSAASLIAMAGDTVSMAENALMMIHAPWTIAMGDANAMRDVADMLDKMSEALSKNYARKSGKTPAAMLALLQDGEDHWFTADEAVAEGYADNITAPIEAKAEFDLSRFRSVPAAAAAYAMALTGDTMPQAQTPAAPAPQAAIPAPAAPTAAPTAVVLPLARTKDQNDEIHASFAPHLARAGVNDILVNVLRDPAITVDAARAQLLAKLGENTEPANPQAQRVEMGSTEGEKMVGATVEAILYRAGVADDKVRAGIGSNPFRGARLLDLARASLERGGHKVRTFDQMDIVAAAFTQSTSDFTTILENAMHKTLQAAYVGQPDTWTKFCARGSVTDFRAHPRYRFGTIANLDTVLENGEFKSKAITDAEKVSITATTKGNIVNVSRQMIVNDDLSAFVGLSGMLGRAAKRTIEAAVYTQIATASGLGPTYSVDSVALYNSAHANIAATGAISATVFDDIRTKMALQMDKDSNDYLDLRPAYLLVPTASGGAARVINDSQYDPDTVANKSWMKPNLVRGMFREIIDTPRLSGTRVYAFADPAVCPTYEVAFLDGNDTPFLDVMQGFTVDGAMYKVRLDFGVALVEYKGTVTAAGA
jgi:ATP-dependent protease ClpP protease subunit